MDRYIDNDETQSYGPQFASNLRRLFPGDGAPHVFMRWCAEQVDAQTAAMRDAMTAQRTTGSVRTLGADEHAAPLTEARDELRAFWLHLQAASADRHEAWKGDLDLFVPGGLATVGRSKRALATALDVAHAALANDKAVPERAKWMKRLDTQMRTVAPLADEGDDRQHAHRSALSEQSVEKRNWLRTYRGVALVLEGVLALLGRDGEYTAAVPHLTVPGARKKSDGAPNVPTGPKPPTG